MIFHKKNVYKSVYIVNVYAFVYGRNLYLNL